MYIKVAVLYKRSTLSLPKGGKKRRRRNNAWTLMAQETLINQQPTHCSLHSFVTAKGPTK